MNSLSLTIPIHILLESTSFPSPSSPTPATTLSDPSIHYHFTPTDGPLDPARYAGSAERAIVWDVEDGTVSSLSQEVITRGVRREGQGESAVWVVEAQEGWDASVKQDGGSELTIDELLAVLQRQEALIAELARSSLEEGIPSIERSAAS